MKKETVYVCPKCGSTEWRFANPVKPSECAINFPGMVNNFLECNNCGYIGIFFEVNRKQLKSLKFKKA